MESSNGPVKARKSNNSPPVANSNTTRITGTFVPFFFS
jgi:hypothetical protein